jgi:multidrug efflux pump
MTSVILSLGGAFLGLAAFKLPFGIIMTSVGVISLAGVVVNNAIVLVDYINLLAGEDFNIFDHIIYSMKTTRPR